MANWPSNSFGPKELKLSVQNRQSPQLAEQQAQ
jgi:hypothetical protein